MMPSMTTAMEVILLLNILPTQPMWQLQRDVLLRPQESLEDKGHQAILTGVLNILLSFKSCFWLCFLFASFLHLTHLQNGTRVDQS